MVNGRKRKIKATASVFSTTNEIVTVEWGVNCFKELL
jgi:hypothetical protein